MFIYLFLYSFAKKKKLYNLYLKLDYYYIQKLRKYS